MFRVYSTKEFPGLQASTELTKVNSSKYIFQSQTYLFFFFLFFFFNVKKHLARWGVRLNIRETERRRRKKRGASAEYNIPHNRKRKRSEACWSTSEDA